MQPLKVLVIVLGLAIVVGLVIVVVTVVQRLGNHGAGGQDFGTASLVLPKGCHVVGMVAAGPRLGLRLGEGADCQIILLVDPESGRETGRIGLQTQP